METLMDRTVIAEIATHFKALTSIVPLRTIGTEAEYEQAISVLNQLLDAGAANENHPLADLVSTLGTLIGEYEDVRDEPSGAKPVDVLRLLMEQHNLSQSDLPEVGTQGVVSEILSGKRDLNIRQVRALCERFQVPASVFI